jgi:hypothetical protein
MQQTPTCPIKRFDQLRTYPSPQFLIQMPESHIAKLLVFRIFDPFYNLIGHETFGIPASPLISPLDFHTNHVYLSSRRLTSKSTPHTNIKVFIASQNVLECARTTHTPFVAQKVSSLSPSRSSSLLCLQSVNPRP